MIDRRALLAELQPAVAALEDDIRGRLSEVEELDARLQGRFEDAKQVGRTAMAFEQWREGEITQAAVAWVLACVFVRFLEDNELIDRPLLSGPGDRRAAAAGQREEYFHANPADSDREYLEHAFRTVARFPAVAALYDEGHNPLWQVGPTGDGATALLALWQRIDPDTGALLHDFSSDDLDTSVSSATCTRICPRRRRSVTRCSKRRSSWRSSSSIARSTRRSRSSGSTPSG